jgi:hypothetical protein
MPPGWATSWCRRGRSRCDAKSLVANELQTCSLAAAKPRSSEAGTHSVSPFAPSRLRVPPSPRMTFYTEPRTGTERQRSPTAAGTGHQQRTWRRVNRAIGNGPPGRRFVWSDLVKGAVAGSALLRSNTPLIVRPRWFTHLVAFPTVSVTGLPASWAISIGVFNG